MKMIKVCKKQNKISIPKICQLMYQQRNFWELTVEINRNRIIKSKSKIFPEMFAATYPSK